MIFPVNSIAHCDALSLMERLEESSYQLIYLDPPWPDQIEFKEQVENTDYLGFIFKVLQQCKRLLTDSGNIFLFSNPELNTDFHPILRQVFGVENYVSEFVIPRRLHGSGYSHHHETLIFYRKSKEFIFNKKILQRPEDEIESLFPYSDGKGRYRLQSLYGPSSRPKFTWKGYNPPDNMNWRFALEKLEELFGSGFIDLSRKQPQLKSYLRDDDRLREVGTIWNDLESGANRLSKNSIKGQPLKFLERIISIGSNSGDTVIDPFCGSGSFLVASANLGRPFIGSDKSLEAIQLSKNRLENNLESKFKLLTQDELSAFPIVWDKYYSLDPIEEDEVVEIILQGESADVEFKESAIWNYNTNRKDPTLIQNIIKGIVAFLNSSEGGSLFIGVKNDKSLIDLSSDFITANSQKTDQDGYSLFLNDKIKSECGGIVIGNYKLKFFTINSCTICKIEVYPSPNPVFYEGDFYVRNNNQSLKLKSEDFYEYQRKRFEN
jgi:DNA modification methylase